MMQEQDQEVWTYDSVCDVKFQALRWEHFLLQRILRQRIVSLNSV